MIALLQGLDWRWPQWVMIGAFALSFGKAFVNIGQPEGSSDERKGLLSLIENTILLFILYSGGFWR